MEIMYPPESFHDDIADDAFDELLAFSEQLVAAIQSGDLHVVRSLGRRGCSHDDEWTKCQWEENCWREALQAACECGHVNVLTYLLDECNASLSALCPYCDWFDPEFEKAYPGWEPMPNPAPPLLIAAASGKTAAVRLLLERGADINAAAFDGQTPFFAACYRGNLEMAHLLHEQRADINLADQDGTAPVHAAACAGHVHIIQFLSQIGVNMEARGNIYIGEDWDQVLHDATPLMIARCMGHNAVVQFLQQPATGGPLASNSTTKRIRSDVSIEERAQKVGVAHRLKAVQPSLLQLIQLGSEEEKAVARKALQKIQIANQQIVARAESAQLKQSKLVLGPIPKK